MPAMDFETIRSANNDLIRAHLHFAILFDSMSNVCPVTLEDPTTGDLTIPETAQSVGVIEKKAGVNLIHSMDNNEIEGYGDAEPVRTIISKRSVSFEAEYLETNLVVLQQFWGTYFSEAAGNLTLSSTGGVTLVTPNLPDNIFYRAYLVTEDDINGDEIYAYYILPQVKLTKVENQTSKDSDAISYKMTFQAFRNTVLGWSVLQGWCGPGWVQLVDQAGFVATPTALTITPASPSITVGGTAEQLVATGSNGVNYTPLVGWSSATPATATVSSTGEVTAVAIGTTVITATYLNSAGASITGTVSVTVTA
jgi:hypothetical protein